MDTTSLVNIAANITMLLKKLGNISSEMSEDPEAQRDLIGNLISKSVQLEVFVEDFEIDLPDFRLSLTRIYKSLQYANGQLYKAHEIGFLKTCPMRSWKLAYIFKDIDRIGRDLHDCYMSGLATYEEVHSKTEEYGTIRIPRSYTSAAPELIHPVFQGVQAHPIEGVKRTLEEIRSQVVDLTSELKRNYKKAEALFGVPLMTTAQIGLIKRKASLNLAQVPATSLEGELLRIKIDVLDIALEYVRERPIQTLDLCYAAGSSIKPSEEAEKDRPYTAVDTTSDDITSANESAILNIARVIYQLEHSASTAAPSELCRLLGNLARQLATLGWYHLALSTAEWEVMLRRTLCNTDPETSNHSLARSLNRLSNLLNDVGRPYEALIYIQESTRLFQELIQPGMIKSQEDCLVTLMNLSNRLDDVGRKADALGVIEEVVERLRYMVDGGSPKVKLKLARALNNISIRLSCYGRSEEALKTIEEAAEMFRSLSDVKPDLAGSLSNMSVHLNTAGRTLEAVKVVEEAIGIYRQLVNTHLVAFRHGLADSLLNLSTYLGDLGRKRERWNAIAEAVGIFRELATDRPAVFRPTLADSLTKLSRLGSPRAGLRAMEEAVSIYRVLAKGEPLKFQAGLVESLTRLSGRLCDPCRKDEALDIVREAMALSARLGRKRLGRPKVIALLERNREIFEKLGWTEHTSCIVMTLSHLSHSSFG